MFPTTYGLRMSVMASGDPKDSHAKLLTETIGSVVRYGPNRIVFNTKRAFDGSDPPPLLSIKALTHLDIYKNESISKARGYHTQPVERADVSLFNCIDRDWVRSKKRDILRLGLTPSVEKLHLRSMVKHTEALSAVMLSDQPHDMSKLGNLAILYHMAILLY